MSDRTGERGAPDTRLIVLVGRPLSGNRNDCKAWEESGAKAAVGKTMTIAEGRLEDRGQCAVRRLLFEWR